MTDTFHCPDAQEFLRLLAAPGALVAVRSLHPQQEWHFRPDALQDALPLLERHSGRRALYACLNPVRPELGGAFAQDEDVTALRWLPLDADPVRPTDTAATDAERDAAAGVMDALLNALRPHLPGLDAALVRCDSGNGSHALIRLPDYPPHAPKENGGRSAQWKALKCLHTTLCKQFSTETVKLDTAVMNPSRIWRLPGTLNVKGDDTPERPHRLARLLSTPDPLVPLDILAYETALTEAFRMAKSPEVASPAQPGKSDHAQAKHAQAAPPEPAALPPWWTELVQPGGRNSSAYQRARWLLNATEGARADADAWEELQAWNKVVCRPPLDRGELRKTFDSAAQAGDNPEYTRPPPLPEGKEGAKSAGAPWPSPLDHAAFHGIAGEIVRAIAPHTEADPAALLVQLLVAAGSALGPGPRFVIEDTPHHANLFAVVVGKTALARKGTAWGRVRAVMAHAAPDWLRDNTGSGLSSGEGLIHAVRDPEEKQEPIKDKGRVTGYQTVITDPGVEDKRLLVIEGEFAGVLKQTERDGNTLSVVARNAWDGLNLQTLTKNRQRATDPHVSVIGHITADELRRYLSSTEAANGFANRFLWVCARRAQLLPFGGSPDPVLMTALTRRLAAALDAAQDARELRRDADADAIWERVYPVLPPETPGLLGSVITRAGAIVMRLALIYALLDAAPCIRAAHLTAALAVWEYAEASCRHIFGDSLGDPLADTLLGHLRAAGGGGLTRTQISQALSNHKDRGRVEAALSLLLTHARIRHEARPDTGGRPADHYFAA